jgi:hypothetical protein
MGRTVFTAAALALVAAPLAGATAAHASRPATVVATHAGSASDAAVAPLAGPRAAVKAPPPLPPPIAPFPFCPNLGYQVHLPAGQTTSTLGFFDLSTSTFVPIKNLGFGANAVGYSQTQNVFWGMDTDPINADEIVRIDSQGNVNNIGQPTDSLGNPVPVQTVTGTVFNDRLYIHNKIDNSLLVIDVKPGSPTLGQVLATVPLSRTSPGVSFLEIGDWDFNNVDGQLYSLEMQGKPVSTKRLLIKINPATGVVTTVADLSALLPDGQNYGAVYVEDQSGIIYVSNNDVNRTHTQSQTFGIQQISPPVVTPYKPGELLNVNDGADCLLATDFGDAPESYKTLNNFGGPGHVISQKAGETGDQLTIGKLVDSDLDGFPSANADGDDKSIPGKNDEDGVPPNTVLDAASPTLTVPVVNTTTQSATLAGWIDRNLNGSFDANERALATVPVGATSVTLKWGAAGVAMRARTVLFGLNERLAPATAPTPTFLRLRLYPGVVADPQPTGSQFINGGEIEDHKIFLSTSPSAPTLPDTGVALTTLLLIGFALVGGGGLVLAALRRRY